MSAVFFQFNRNVDFLQTKWKHIKANARRRNQLIRQSQTQTGGGKLSEAEKRIISSQLYSDIVDRLGASASGVAPRFDSDSTSSSTAFVDPPTTRLRRTRSTVSFVDADEIFDDVLMADDMQEPSLIDEAEAGPSSASQSSTNRKQSVKRLSTSSRGGAKRKRSVSQADNMELLNEYIIAQQDSLQLQTKYHEIQIKRAEIALETEILRKRQAEVELEKSTALKEIEVSKQQRMAELEIEAAERNLANLY